jgi:hypothetical protein
VTTINSADQLIYKAVTLLQEHEDVEGALDALHEAMLLSKVAGHTLQLIRAKMLLGELLEAIDQPLEAVQEFRDVVSLAETFDGESELVDQELAVAKERLASLPQEH